MSDVRKGDAVFTTGGYVGTMASEIDGFGLASVLWNDRIESTLYPRWALLATTDRNGDRAHVLYL